MFLIQVIVSFVIGGLFIGCITILAERVPLRWRGTVLAFPSTVALGFFFIGLTKSPLDIPEAAVTAIAGTLISSYIFALVFSYLSRFKLWISLVRSFTIWTISSFLILTYPPSNLVSAIFLYGFPFFLVSYLLIRKLPQITSFTPVPFTLKHILVRSIAGGCVVTLTLILAKTLGNTWGGIFSPFPAVFATTLSIYYFAHGKEIIPSVGKSLFFPGGLAFALYPLIAAFAFPAWGIWWGTLASYIGCAVFIFVWMKVQDILKRDKETSKG